MKKVAMLHTSAATLTMMQQLITDIMPDVEVMHLVEESMIKQVMKAQGVTPNIAARIADYVHIAERRTAISLLPPAPQLVLRWSNASL